MDPSIDGRAFRPRSTPDLDTSLVTVVVPARDEEEHIGQCLESILGQDWQNLQVLVMDGDSRDRTREIVESHRDRDPRIELHPNPRRTVPAALNSALTHARGAWWVRVDAHSAISSSYVRRSVDWLASGSWAGVGGRLHPVGRTPTGRAIAIAMGSAFGVGGSGLRLRDRPQAVEHVVFGCYRTEQVRELGGWDERLPSNQDVEFNYRLRSTGELLLYDPQMVVTYACRQTLRALLTQYRRYGRGKTRLLALHPGAASPRHAAPVALVAALSLTGALAVGGRPRPFVAAATPYAGLLALASAAKWGQSPDLRSRLSMPLVLATMHIGYGLGFLEGLPNLVRGPGTGADDRRS